MSNQFSQSVVKKIGYYVYFLRDPIKNEVFYVGKGIGNRVLEQVAGALSEPTKSDNFYRIRTIEKLG